MKYNKEETRKYFKDEMEQKYYDFLKQRNIVAKQYVEALRKGEYGILFDNRFFIEGEEYSVECVLASGRIDIFDLIRNNEIYGIPAREGTVIAILMGDDYLFLKPNDERVYYYCRDTEEEKCIAKNYQTLEEMVHYREEE